MKESPILFSGPMVRALLNGTKTQTRRLVKPQPTHFPDGNLTSRFLEAHVKCPYGIPGDRLWVKETWHAHEYYNGRRPIDIPEGVTIECAESPEAVATEGNGHRRIYGGERGRLRPSIFMRRWMSRITLEIKSVRVEQLQAISESDAKSEGIFLNDRASYAWENGVDHKALFPSTAYRALWESINGKGSWKQNPWVWVVEFRRVTP